MDQNDFYTNTTIEDYIEYFYLQEKLNSCKTSENMKPSSFQNLSTDTLKSIKVDKLPPFIIKINLKDRVIYNEELLKKEQIETKVVHLSQKINEKFFLRIPKGVIADYLKENTKNNDSIENTVLYKFAKDLDILPSNMKKQEDDTFYESFGEKLLTNPELLKLIDKLQEHVKEKYLDIIKRKRKPQKIPLQLSNKKKVVHKLNNINSYIYPNPYLRSQLNKIMVKYYMNQIDIVQFLDSVNSATLSNYIQNYGRKNGWNLLETGIRKLLILFPLD